jgi:cobalt/nickel transport system permease protein
MTLTLDQLPYPVSPLSCLDPRWKLVALLAVTLMVALLHTLPAATLALAAAWLLAVLARLPLRWYLARMGALAGFLVFVAVLLPLLIRSDGPGWNLGPLRFSVEGLRVALLLLLKALAIVTLMLVLLTTAPLTATLQAAHALHMPSLLIHLSLLTYRYVFVLGDELSRLRVALRVRGYRNRANRHSYRTVGHVAGTLLVRGAERAERVGQAMRCRGFDGRFRSLTTFRTRAADVVFLILLTGSAAMLLAWDLIQH